MPQRHKDTKKYFELTIFVKPCLTAFRRQVCAFVSLWLIFFTNSFGQDDSTRLLNSIPVQASKDSVIHIKVNGSTVPHFIISSEKLNDLAVSDVGSAMKYVPGVQLKDYGGIGGIKTVSFRSLGANHTSVSVDGSRIPNVQSGAINLSSFEIFGVKEIVFTSGQVDPNLNLAASTYLQANAISVRSVLAYRPTKFTLKLYSNSTTINSFDEGIIVQFPIKENAFFGIQAMTKFGKSDYNFVYPLGGISETQKRQNSQLNTYKVKAMGGFLLKNSFFRFGLSYLNNTQELPGAIILYNPSNDQKLWNEDMRATVNYHATKDNWNLLGNAFYQRNYTRYYDPHFLNLDGFIDSRYTQQNSGAGLMARRTFDTNPRSDLFFGTDAVYSQLVGNNLPGSPKRFENNSVVGYSGGFHHFKIAMNVSLQVIRDQAISDSATMVRNFIKPSPFISLAWMPLKDYSLKVRSFYKRTFLMPTFNDLYYNFIGNNSLKPEEANLFDVGLSYDKKFRKWTTGLTADLYYNQVDNKIVAIPTKDLFNWSMQNIGKTQIKGFDLGALISYEKNKFKITLNSSYTYNQSLDMTDSESTTYQQQIPYTPFHSATGGFTINWKGFSFNSNLLYTGFRYSLNENIYANYLPPFTDISINLSKKIELKNGSVFNLNLAAMNLLNKNYEVIRSFPMPGRYYQFTFQFSL